MNLQSWRVHLSESNALCRQIVRSTRYRWHVVVVTIVFISAELVLMAFGPQVENVQLAGRTVVGCMCILFLSYAARKEVRRIREGERGNPKAPIKTGVE